MKLFLSAILKFLLGVTIVGLLLFLPAGTLNWRQAWVFMAALFIPMFIVGIVLAIKNPHLLQIRLEAKEQEDEQKDVIKFSGLMFIIGFLLAGFNFRYSWFVLPSWISPIVSVVFLIAYAFYLEVLRENTYLSRTIRVQVNQKVIDTGLYGVVRHPMYAVTLVLFLMIPLILGSVCSFIIFLLYPLIIYKRICNEEEVLKKELPGYLAYCEKVRYRLFPGIW